MRNTIRFISTLALVLALGVMSGCSGGGSNTKTPGDTGSTDGSGAVGSDSGAAGSGSGAAGSDTGSDAASGDSSSSQSDAGGTGSSSDGSSIITTGGIITTVAGGGNLGFFELGDGGPATQATLLYPAGLVFDSSDNLYITSGGYNTSTGSNVFGGVVRRVDKKSGLITTVAGGGISKCQGCLATSTSLSVGGFMAGVVFDTYGNLYFTDISNASVEKVDANGIITTVAGGVKSYVPGDNNAGFANPTGLAFDSSGNLYISDQYQNSVRRIDKTTNIITFVAGPGMGKAADKVAVYVGDGCPAKSASLAAPNDIKFDSSDNLYIADRGHSRVRRVDKQTGIITTVAGGGSLRYDGIQAIKADLIPNGFAFDSFGSLYIADRKGPYRIRKVDVNGIITTVAGGGASLQYNYGDGGPATSATFYFGDANVLGLAFDSGGNLYIADENTDGKGRVRMVTAVASPTVKSNGAVTSYTVGGAVTGLSSGTLILHNGADDLKITNTMNDSGKWPTVPFTFPTAVINNSTYYVTVKTQPNGQTCELSYYSLVAPDLAACGVVTDGNVQTISVNCN